jgi:hypothetical protein
MRARRLLLLFLVLGLGSSGLASANWTASGTFRYVDREFDQNGFTGVEPPLPIRFATIEVRDFNAQPKKAVLATGATDANGNFSIPVTDSSTRTVYVRILTASTAVSNVFLKVQNRLIPKNPYAVASANVANHAPNASVNFGTLTAAIGAGGDAFNIYDTGIRVMDFIQVVNGSKPGSGTPLTYEWEAGSGAAASSYDRSTRTVTVGDNSGYNDTVFGHESGHYAFHVYSATDSPGGAHHLLDCNQDLRLAYEEGRATWFGQAMRRSFNLPHPELYVKTTGAPGPGNLDFYFDVENENPYSCDGATSEVAVYSALWDVNDSAATADSTPGVDDEPAARPDADNWDVDKNFVRTAVNKSLEDFWDGWFTRGKGFKSDLITAFQRTGVEYSIDADEPNDTATAARPIAVGATLHRTFFADVNNNDVGEADNDFFSFTAIAGTTYTIETLNLWGKANTSLVLYASDRTTVLASNDNRAAGDDSSLIVYTAPSAGALYIKSFHAADLGIYGSYDLRLTSNP